jgi:ABC-type multidrug transport system permease subunit
MFLTYFTDIGRHLCTILIGLIIFLSSAFYPAGFFPESIQFLSRLLPTYYSVVLIRIFTLKNADFSVISDYLFMIALSVIISAVTLLLSYRRVKNWSMQL